MWMYEKRLEYPINVNKKDINMASADRLLRLAKVLYCRPESLMEEN